MRALQARFKDWILSRAPEIDVSVFAPAPGDSKEARFRVYEKAYWIRLTQAIEEDFERTRELLGDEKFHALVKDFAERNPSTSWTLAQAGAHLPDFVVGCHEWNEIPFLARACEWDWLRVEAFLAPTASTASAPGTFRIDPSARALSLTTEEARVVASERFAVGTIVEEAQGASPLLLIWRTGSANEGYELEERLLPGRSAEVWRAVLETPDPQALGSAMENLGYDPGSARSLFAAFASLGILAPT